MINQTLRTKISVIVPFFNTPKELFIKCLDSLKKLNLDEVILVDDCSTDKEIIKIAKKSGFKYLKTPYQSGGEGLAFNMGVRVARNEYICKVDSDDELLDLPLNIYSDIHLAFIDRSGLSVGITIDDLILRPRAIINGMVAKKEIWQKYSLEKDKNVYGDIVMFLRILNNNYSITIHNKVNYLYKNNPSSIMNTNNEFYHRLRHIQTVARFCQYEDIEPLKAIEYMKLAMLNLQYGGQSMNYLSQLKETNEK